MDDYNYWTGRSEEGRYALWSVLFDTNATKYNYSMFCDLMDRIFSEEDSQDALG